jgi:3-oxoacyl-[acyl-carrier protein] reductase
MAKRFQDRCGIVTGAASGIGRATAIHLAERGARLALADIDQAGMSKTGAEIERQSGVRPLTRCTDVSSARDVDALATETRVAFGRIDFLVTSAGILRRTAFVDITPAEWDLMMGVNLKGPFLCCLAVVPIMIQQGSGVIVNISSLAGRSTSVWGGAHYTAAKHGVIGLTRHMARELGPMGIRVNAFCPGGTLTPMVLNATTPENRDETAAQRPLRRWATAEEQARVIAFLLSNDSAFMTGACVDSNGGALMV